MLLKHDDTMLVYLKIHACYHRKTFHSSGTEKFRVAIYTHGIPGQDLEVVAQRRVQPKAHRAVRCLSGATLG